MTQLVSRGLTGSAGANGSVRAAISSDGTFVAFQSDANDLVAGDTISGDPSISITGQVPAGGGARFDQAYYRNAASFCSAATFNLTNAVSVPWVP